MRYKGIVFDFNGTMYFDSDKHEKAWNEIRQELGYEPLSPELFRQNTHGKTSKEILRYFFNNKYDDNKINFLIRRKGVIYRQLCLQDPNGMHLVDGLENYLDYLKANNVPIAIATSASDSSIKFYIEVFHLDKWFSREYIINTDSSMKSKPAPDIYLRAAKKLNLNPKDFIVYEDAPSGVMSAFNAGVEKIIGVNDERLNELTCISNVIFDYSREHEKNMI